MPAAVAASSVQGVGPENASQVVGALEPTDDSAPWPDETAEAAFRAEALDRGEAIAPRPREEPAEEVPAGSLPPLDALVERIPAAVRDTLDDLFRVKFVTVQRVPKKALKPVGGSREAP